jgi:hypothetical protein
MRFQLDALTTARCFRTGDVVTLEATGTGTWSHGNTTSPATIEFVVTDAGEPGTQDVATYTIVSGGQTVLEATGTLTFSNHHFHPTQ